MGNQLEKFINTNVVVEDFQIKKNGIDFSINAIVDFVEDQIVSIVIKSVEAELLFDWCRLELTEHLEKELLDHLDGNEEFYQASWELID